MSFERPKYVCCQCGRTLSENSFYRSNSPIYSAIGHLAICKACLTEDYRVFKSEKMGAGDIAMQRICMLTDTYYDKEIFLSCDEKNDKVVGSYFRQVNLSQYKNRTFGDSMLSGNHKQDAMEEMNKQDFAKERNESVDQRLIRKWGNGLTADDYEALEAHYKYLKSANPNCDSNQEIFIIDLCYIKIQQMKAYLDQKIDDYNKLTEQYRKTFRDAKLTISKDESGIINDSWGEWIERISQYTPEEYYKNRKLFKDFDGLGEYITRFLYRPLRNLMHGTNERDNEYFVPDGSDSDGYTED